MVRLVWVVALTGCFEDSLVYCADGRACAPGYVCDDIHATCVTRDQLSACANQPDEVACETSMLDGRCFQGVCLMEGCGNRVVEAARGEMCDDGNERGGDGCSADCTSTERCANGVVDAALGEQCDDGDLVSHDGCSSGCLAEVIDWKAQPLTLAIASNFKNAAFDQERRRLVVPAGNSTWEWDGQHWTVSVSKTFAVVDAASYDSDRKRVFAVGFKETYRSTFHAAEWNGTSWEDIATTNRPGTAVRRMVYDHARRKHLALTNVDLFSFNPATAQWQYLGPAPVSGAGANAAYDEVRNVVVFATSANTFEWNGTQWSAPLSAPPGGNAGLVFDATRGHILAVGGGTSSTTHGQIHSWTGTVWQNTAVTIPARNSATVWYDATSTALGIFGGLSETYPLGITEILELAGTTVTDRTEPQPTIDATIGYDRVRDRWVMFGGSTGIWTWNGAWQGPSPSTPLDTKSYVFDPVRGGFVTVAGNGLTWLFTDTWTELGLNAVSFGAQANIMAYDFARRGVVAVVQGGAQAFFLSSSGGEWTQIAAGVNFVNYVAYDHSTGHVVALASGSTPGSPSSLHDLVDNEWVPSLAPGNAYGLASSLDARSIVLLPFHTTDSPNLVWERRDLAFASAGKVPGLKGTGAFEWSRGRTVVRFNDAFATYLMIRQYVSATPDETCVDGEDADGDGAANCADPDCWTKCFPACPLATASCL